MGRADQTRGAGPAGFVVAGLIALVLASPVAVIAAPPEMSADRPPRASVTDIEDEVMCPICGTLLELSESPQAQRQRVFIRGLVAKGLTKEQIKDALVAQYGNGALALPKGSGFSLSAYLVPILAFLVAAIGLAIAVRRWRRATPDTSSGTRPPVEPDGEDAKRLDADLARYDL